MKGHALALGLLLGCVHTPAPETWSSETEVPERLVLNPVRTRFSFTAQSPVLELAIQADGGLAVARPGGGRMDLFGPLGHPTLSVSTDQSALSIQLIGERRHLLAAEAEGVLRDLTRGAVGLEEALGVLLGELPSADPARTTHTEEGLEVRWMSGADHQVLAVIDPDLGVPTRLEIQDLEGSSALIARYGAFKEGPGGVLPEDLTLQVPELELEVTVRYRGWQAWEPRPDVFATQAPAGFSSTPLEEAVRAVLMQAAEQ